MKKILFILFISLFFACEKEQCLQCATDQTFTLIFKNYNQRVSYLFISGNKYDVKKSTDKLYFTVSVKDISTIHVLYRVNYKGEDSKTYYKDTTSYIIGTPNVCGKYYYYF